MNNTKNAPDNNVKLTENNTQIPDSFDNNTDSSFSFAELLKDGAKQGFKAVKLYSLITLLFGGCNLIFFIIHVISNRNHTDYKSLVLISLIIGIAFIILSFVLAYKYVLINTIEMCYTHLKPFFQKVCTKVIDLVISGGNKVTGKDIHKSLNIGSLMIEVYGKKLPKYIQKGLIFILGKIPFGEFLKTMHAELNQHKDKRTLSYILYLEFDKYISVNLFGGVSLSWMYSLFSLNIIIQIALIYFS